MIVKKTTSAYITFFNNFVSVGIHAKKCWSHLIFRYGWHFFLFNRINSKCRRPPTINLDLKEFTSRYKTIYKVKKLGRVKKYEKIYYVEAPIITNEGQIKNTQIIVKQIEELDSVLEKCKKSRNLKCIKKINIHMV